MSDHDIVAKRGIGYAKSVEDALGHARRRRLRRRLHPAPDPGRAGARDRGTDENMPPKSTYFFPKVLTGLVFNPVR